MVFTNPEYDMIPDGEMQLQRYILAPLRQEHMHQIVDSGLADRLSWAFSTFNQSWRYGRLASSPAIYPIREHIWNLPDALTDHLRVDLGYKPRRNQASGSPDALDQVIASKAENYVLEVGWQEESTGIITPHRYAAGLLLERGHAARLYEDKYVPIRGIYKADIEMLDRQLQEVQALAEEQELTIIDSATLVEGKGEFLASERE